jgi:CPA1 family monovalent cation:H+ antiporter
MKVGIVGAGRAGSACALAADVRSSGAPQLQFEQAQHDMGEGRGDTDLYADAGARIMELYHQRIDGRSKTGEERALARRMDEIERKLRLAGLRAERTGLYRIARSHKLSDETARKLVREIELLEARFGTR